jgi:cytochrome c peroxidase
MSALALPFVDASALALVPESPAFPPSLKGVWVPRPTRLSEFVRDEQALNVLGKSLFWDVTVGSDMQTACASCHGHAGIDPRRLNVVHPGANGTFDSRTGPGEKKGADFFPTTVFADPSSRFSPILRDLDDIAGSQGVLRQILIDVDTGAQVELCDPLPEPVFEGNGRAWRQVTGRNPPTTINAVFNIRNFWDGRANPWFNGVNGLGPIDPAARVWRWDGGKGEPVQVPVMLDYSSLASQAVGPVLNAVEMSCSGRNWPQLASRLLGRRPLAT